MLINDRHIQLATARPGLEKIDSPKGRTYLADIETIDHGPQKAFIKLLSLEDIAKEALCAVLAREHYLPVKNPFYVDISNIEFNTYPNVNMLAFGLLQDHMPSLEVKTYTDELLKWGDLLRCAVFDEWIANKDRYPNNLRYEGDGIFWLFDHDEAMPSYVPVDNPVNSQLLQIVSKDKSEFELYRIRDIAMGFVDEYKTINWDWIYELLRPEILTGGKGLFEKYVNFLINRIDFMRNIIMADLGIKQQEINFNNKEDNKRETNK